MLLGVSGVLFAISVYCLYSGGVNVITLASMFLPAVICWKVSNMFIDGTLTREIGDGATTEIVRELAVSQIFQLLGIILFIGIFLQIYQFWHENRILGELEMGDE